MKHALRWAVAAAFFALSAPASAGLLGDTVQGTLAFGFPPGFGQFWPAPTQVVGAGIEFVYSDGANDDNADFSDLQLVVTDNVKASANGWKMTFQTPDLLGATIGEISDNFTSGGVDFSLSGDLLTLTWTGTDNTDGLLTAVYSITTRRVPEPASLALLGLGLLGLVGLGYARRR